MTDPQYPPYSPPVLLADMGGPVAACGVSESGALQVVADRNLPPQTLLHALDYADRLAELVPEQRHAEPPTAPDTRIDQALRWLAAAGVAHLALAACTIPELTVTFLGA